MMNYIGRTIKGEAEGKSVTIMVKKQLLLYKFKENQIKLFLWGKTKIGIDYKIVSVKPIN